MAGRSWLGFGLGFGLGIGLGFGLDSREVLVVKGEGDRVRRWTLESG